MKKRTSLGDFISALYDAVAPVGSAHRASQVVTACTLDLLRRQRRRNLIALLCESCPAPELLH